MLLLQLLNIGDNFEIITRQSGRNVEITFRIAGYHQINLEELFDDNIMATIQKLKGLLGKGSNIRTVTAITLSISPLSTGK